MATLVVAPDELLISIQNIVHQHFANAHQRVPDFYRKYFLSSRQVISRHWQHRKDIPGDLLAVPRMLGQGVKKLAKKHNPSQTKISGKEQALVTTIEKELLRIDLLTQTLLASLTQNDLQTQKDWQQCEALLMSPMNANQRARIQQFLLQKAQNLSGPREGGREFLTFLLIGVIGTQLAGKVTFGSAVATGSSLAGSVYISQQSWWYSTWLGLTGVPGWVSWVGAAGGLVACLAVAPVISPFAELAVNRLRGEKFLHSLIDEVEHQSFQNHLDIIDAAGIAAGVTQIIPDLLALLRQLRI